ncbi:hypothetical protein HPB47_025532 [Ixodes persulcatus]|uniref:Uncharacterized protein n=1 Tax=Ixodes persulcatus TaxID=34615 RepID=A0AC60Q176_IXOPE|nr:hypothetical protein HPB47_025532 [Ixodes persulcatus]
MALNFTTCALQLSACDEYGAYRGRLGRGCSWTREETMLLLDLYEKERLSDERSVEFPPRNTPKYQKVHQAISGFLGAHGYTRSPMQVRERLKRLKRDFRENRHGEFTDRVGAILAKRGASPPLAASTNGAPHQQGSSPDHEACYPVVLVKTEVGSPEARDASPDENVPQPAPPVGPELRSPVQAEEDSEPRPVLHPQRPRRFSPSHGDANGRPVGTGVRAQQRVVRLLGQLVAENRRQAQATEAFHQQVLYQMHLISCSLQVLAAGRTHEARPQDASRLDAHNSS